MVTIRLTEDEFQQIRTRAELSGAPSVSEFTRSAIHALLRNGARLTLPRVPDSVESRFATINARLRTLEALLETLMENYIAR